MIMSQRPQLAMMGLIMTGDGLTDMDDPGCTGPTDVDEKGVVVCDDGIDNDGDTFTDYAVTGGDPDCYSISDPNENLVIWYVNDDAIGAENGTSWDDAFTTIQEAIAVAVASDQVWAAQGTYYPGWIITDGVKLYGGFAGTESSLAQRGYFEDYPTLLDALGSPVGSIHTGDRTRMDGFIIEKSSQHQLCCLHRWGHWSGNRELPVQE